MIHNVIQGSSEWFDLKCGKVTSSRVDDATSFLKRQKENEPRKETAARAHLRNKIISEILTGKHSDSYVSAAMEWGTEWESLARTEYEQATGNDVRLVGYVDHPQIQRGGASPDGLVNPDGAIEIKCPQSNTHIDYLISRCVPQEYVPQCTWVLACTGRKWIDFVSFDPRMPKKHKLLVVRMNRDEEKIGKMEREVEQFLEEVDRMLERIEASDNYLVGQLEASLAARK